eukprot:scaffold7072_cov267-Pinguiococcus_pyrenoidosus.AAC.10
MAQPLLPELLKHQLLADGSPVHFPGASAGSEEAGLVQNPPHGAEKIHEVVAKLLPDPCVASLKLRIPGIARAPLLQLEDQVFVARELQVREGRLGFVISSSKAVAKSCLQRQHRHSLLQPVAERAPDALPGRGRLEDVKEGLGVQVKHAAASQARPRPARGHVSEHLICGAHEKALHRLEAAENHVGVENTQRKAESSPSVAQRRQQRQRCTRGPSQAKGQLARVETGDAQDGIGRYDGALGVEQDAPFQQDGSQEPHEVHCLDLRDAEAERHPREDVLRTELLNGRPIQAVEELHNGEARVRLHAQGRHGPQPRLQHAQDRRFGNGNNSALLSASLVRGGHRAEVGDAKEHLLLAILRAVVTLFGIQEKRPRVSGPSVV